jgi:hypothetical protein
VSIVQNKVSGQNKYSGEVDADGMPHGHGEIIVGSSWLYKDKIIIGAFKHGFLSGIVEMRVKTIGSVSMFKLVGDVLQDGSVCTIKLVNGDVVHTQYANQLPNGLFVEYGSKGVRIGRFKDHNRIGTSLLIKKNGNKVVEEWKNDWFPSENKGVLLF